MSNAPAASPIASATNPPAFQGQEHPTDVRMSCILAAKSVADAVRSSLGPRGMDKLIQLKDGTVIITNDGATILKHMGAAHPASKLMVSMSQAQDVAAGDGTTSVVIFAGAFLAACKTLLEKKLHPSLISDALKIVGEESLKIIDEMKIPFKSQTEFTPEEREILVNSATTSLSSKLASQWSDVLAPLAVDSVLRVADNGNVDLTDIRVVQKVGGVLEDSELVDGIVFEHRLLRSAQAPRTITDAKIAMIQFQLSPPKTDMDSQVILTDYDQMDRVQREQRKYILQLVQAISKTGANVVLLQKSVLRDAISDLALTFLQKKGILVVKDIERTDVDFVCRTLNCKPIASVEGLSADKLGFAGCVEEKQTPGGAIVKITGLKTHSKTISVLLRGSNELIIGEAERSLHDALCVIRSLVYERALLPGGGAAEVELAVKLAKKADEIGGEMGHCIRCFADALDIVPYTLAENAGLRPLEVVTQLRDAHTKGQKNMGVSVVAAGPADMKEEDVLQPFLVTKSAVSFAVETVRMIMKVDDILATR
ncbi:T-complex protein 1 subunit delta [Tritrichomonas foetus]|uniref:T-complex protein 1 subunit delta n=1 Tax=Tritrichomonas foetus TaxID=1144522 RepID=A0A1J4K3W6_9EUKA|nr:T-complex protein 1 subunit delta [Tritrichomonas foetus]|eukprot:OHT06079.1 T-complex protein 1 subunit delta [Tritrichomonas foetus]